MKQYNNAEVEIEKRMVGGKSYNTIESKVQIHDSGYVKVDKLDKLFPPHKIEYIEPFPDKDD